MRIITVKFRPWRFVYLCLVALLFTGIVGWMAFPIVLFSEIDLEFD